jgi:D-amino-acid dehydrogenase
VRIIVVGAGIVGAGTAYHLSVAGARVTLVDRADEGQATAAGAGIVCPWLSRGRDPARYALSSAGARYYPELIERLAADGRSDTGYARTGALALAGSEDEVREIAERARERRSGEPAVGEVTVLDPGEARRLFPPLRGDRPAVHVTGAARVDGRRLRDTLLAAAERHGAERRSGSARVTLADGGWTVRVDGDPVEADAVVLAAGAWAADALASPAGPLPVAPQRGQIVHLRLPDADTGGWPIVLPQSDHYLLAFEDSRIVVGATREAGSGFDHRVTAAGLREVLDEAISVAPGLADATVADVRVGFRPASLDERPLLGPVAGAPGVVVATGFGPTGLTMGPYASAVAADLALGRTPEIDLSPYDPSRAGG